MQQVGCWLALIVNALCGITIISLSVETTAWSARLIKHEFVLSLIYNVVSFFQLLCHLLFICHLNTGVFNSDSSVLYLLAGIQTCLTLRSTFEISSHRPIRLRLTCINRLKLL